MKVIKRKNYILDLAIRSKTFKDFENELFLFEYRNYDFKPQMKRALYVYRDNMMKNPEAKILWDELKETEIKFTDVQKNYLSIVFNYTGQHLIRSQISYRTIEDIKDILAFIKKLKTTHNESKILSEFLDSTFIGFIPYYRLEDYFNAIKSGKVKK